jgi:hypothetical protein
VTGTSSAGSEERQDREVFAEDSSSSLVVVLVLDFPSDSRTKDEYEDE